MRPKRGRNCARVRARQPLLGGDAKTISAQQSRLIVVPLGLLEVSLSDSAGSSISAPTTVKAVFWVDENRQLRLIKCMYRKILFPPITCSHLLHNPFPAVLLFLLTPSRSGHSRRTTKR
ncbi:unnamed protein product [Protopolystoma xenopodis]|uniref:Uncharacterized protein n=1 Tax=Protopolystoma xenopodis TaxID=117903 RepID=A0A3S5BTW7_9PLAT|nr:unnamed protein product [Protopolystoma xenopodis]